MSEMMQVPDGWEVLSLEKCSTVTNSNVDKKISVEEQEIKLCNYMDVYANDEIDNSIDFMIATATEQEIKKFTLKKDDVIITKDSESPDDIGIPSYVAVDLKDVICGYHLTMIRPKKNCHGKYLSLLLQGNYYKKYFGKLASGSTRFALSLNTISQTLILLPQKKEQEKIAKILSTLDKAIESTNRLIEKEKNIKTALMQELLTNGIDQNGQIRTKATHTYKQSELGLIPDEWEVVSLDDFFKLKSGDTKPEDTSNNGIYEVYGGNGITGYSNSKNNNEETLIIGRVGEYCGSIYLVNECWITDNALYITKKIKKFDTKYMFYLLYFLNLNQYKAETGQPLLNQTIIGNVKTSYPRDFEEQKQIAKILSTQDKKIETEETNLAKLKELKKGLMNDLLSGKVRVKV